MKKAIIGKKVGMTQIFDEAGKVIPVTVIEAGPCVVVQKMTKEKEGYDAVQFGYEEVAEKKLSKPEAGHLKKAGVGMVKHLKEFRLEDSSKLEVDRHQQGQGLRRRHQALRPGPYPDEPRRRPRPPSCGLHGLEHRSLPHLPGQEAGRPHGRGAGHRAEP